MHDMTWWEWQRTEDVAEVREKTFYIKTNEGFPWVLGCSIKHSFKGWGQE